MAHQDSRGAAISHSVSDGVVTVKYIGEVGGVDLIRGREAFLDDPAFVAGMSFLIDLTEASLASLEAGELRRVAVHGREMARDWGTHFTAVVAPRDLNFGVSRMYSVLGARPGLTLNVFRDYDEAAAWLREVLASGADGERT